MCYIGWYINIFIYIYIYLFKHQYIYVIYLGLMLRVRLFVHVHPLILVYYVFPQLVKRVLIHSLIDLLCMLLQHCGMPLI